MMLAGAQTARNLFLLTCANKLDRCSRSRNSSILGRPNGWATRVFAILGRPTAAVPVAPIGISAHRRGVAHGGFREVDIAEKCLRNLLEGVPTIPSRFVVGNTFHSYAEEINNNPESKRRTYNFAGAYSWRDVGLQILTAAGWRPDCVVAHEVNFNRAGPPVCAEPAPTVFGSFGATRWYNGAEHEPAAGNMEIDVSCPLTIEVRAFYFWGYGFACSFI